jgi:hypothetical protein
MGGVCIATHGGTFTHSPCVGMGGLQDLEGQLSWTQRQLKAAVGDSESKGEGSDSMDDRWKSDVARRERDESALQVRLQQLTHVASQVRVPLLHAGTTHLLCASHHGHHCEHCGRWVGGLPSLSPPPLIFP